MKRLQRRGIRAIASSFLLLTGSAAWADGMAPNSGLVHFTGEIVADPYQVTSPAPPSAADIVRSRPGAPGQLMFERRSTERPSACIGVQAVRDEAVDLAFVDARGRPQAMQAGRLHCIGQDGGMLSVAPRAAGARLAALVTVAYD